MPPPFFDVIFHTQMKQLRRQVAELLRNGHNESARIKVESVIRDSLLMQVRNLPQ